MAIDQSPLGTHIQEQMQEIDNDDEIPEGAQIGAIITIVEVVDPETGYANMRIRANVPGYYAVGLLEAGKAMQMKLMGI